MKILQLIPHMNCTKHKIIFSLLLLIVATVPTAEAQKFRHVARTVPAEPESTGLQKSVIPGKDSILYQPRPADEIINSIPLGDLRPMHSKMPFPHRKKTQCLCACFIPSCSGR